MAGHVFNIHANFNILNETLINRDVISSAISIAPNGWFRCLWERSLGATTTCGANSPSKSTPRSATSYTPDKALTLMALYNNLVEVMEQIERIGGIILKPHHGTIAVIDTNVSSFHLNVPFAGRVGGIA